MRQYFPWYIFCFMVLVTGALASMAQNDYGISVMGYACLGFALTFGHELIFGRRKDVEPGSRPYYLSELIVLLIVSLLLAARNFFIEIPRSAALLLLLAVVLALIYIVLAVTELRLSKTFGRTVTTAVSLYFIALFGFLFIGVMALLNIPVNSRVFAIAVVFLLAFLAAAVVVRRRRIADADSSAVDYFSKWKNKSMLVLIVVATVSLFGMLNRSDILPDLYTNEKPDGYIKLLRENDAEGGGDKHLHELDQRYTQFVRKYKGKIF